MVFVSSAANAGPGLGLRAARIAAAYGCLGDNMPIIPIFVPDDILDVIHEIRPKDKTFKPFIVDLILLGAQIYAEGGVTDDDYIADIE